MRSCGVPSSSLLLIPLLAIAPTASHAQMVTATVETVPVPSSGDAADDPAIWLHPTDTSLSTVIGTDKDSGIGVYDLAGAQIEFRSDGELNNVDVRYNFLYGGGLVDIAAASNRTDNSISVYEIDPTFRTLHPIAAGGGISVGIEVYGFCLYSSNAGDFYAFVNSKDGEVEQWELALDMNGDVTGTLVRSFDVGSQTEGCVADDVHGALYIGEENVGIWRYGAEPGDGTTRTSVDTTRGNGPLKADVEGLTIWYRDTQAGYLLVSSQGNDSFAVYERQSNAYVGSFSIVAGAIDAVSGTDGIDVTNVGLGLGLESGLFAVQDDDNPGGNQNYKLVPWDDIANAFAPPLDLASTWDPRAPFGVPAVGPWARLALAFGLLAGGPALRRYRVGRTSRPGRSDERSRPA